VVVEARPLPNQQPQYGQGAYAQPYQQQQQQHQGYLPAYNQQQPTQLLPRQKAGLPMWLVGVASGLAALVILAVVYIVVMPPPKAKTSTVATTTTTTTAPATSVAGNGPFGAARGAFATVLQPKPTTTAAPTTAPTATATATETATATAAPPTTTTATTVATATAAPTATHTAGPTQVPVAASMDKGYLRVITVPPCDQWYDNGTAMGACPIVNKPLPVGTHRITLNTNTPKVSKTISVIIMSGQVASPPLVILSP